MKAALVEMLLNSFIIDGTDTFRSVFYFPLMSDARGKTVKVCHSKPLCKIQKISTFELLCL